MATRKRWSKEFTLDTFCLVLESGYSQAGAARSRDICIQIPYFLYMWRVVGSSRFAATEYAGPAPGSLAGINGVVAGESAGPVGHH
jgi:transposase-like protein